MAFANDALPRREQIESFAGEDGGVFGVENGGEQLVRWQKSLQAALKKTPNLEAATGQLAPAYGLSRNDMRELITLWVLASDQISDAAIDERHRRFTALARATHQAILVMAAAGVAWGEIGKCESDEFTPLMEGAADPVAAAWTLVKARDLCAAWDGAFAARFPDESMAALLHLRRDTAPGTADELALYAYLTGDAALGHIAEADRPYVSAQLNRAYVGALFSSGLTDEALAVIERLPSNVRSNVLAGTLPERNVLADGLAVPMEESADDRREGLELAAGYALRGRTADAEAALAAWGHLDKARQEFGCIYRSSSAPMAGSQCGRGLPSGLHAIALDHLLSGSSEDPYPVAEAYLSSELGSSTILGTGVWADLTCTVLSEPQYKNICDDARQMTVFLDRQGLLRDEPDSAGFVPAIDAARVPGYQASRARYQAELDAAAVHYGGKAGGDGQDHEEQRAAQRPAPARFQQLPLPEIYRGDPARRTEPWTAKLTPLPDGYNLVRVERSGARVVAISLSQNYDPTGEVSQGGYWVHLSEDGGRTWGRPLYTGLAERWPYVVLPASRLPLIDGEVLDVAVEIRELDPMSISYPPVALRSRRRQSNLYLKIPIAELTRDSDGSGLTDIAKEHLLLKPIAPGARTPFIVGRTPVPACSASEAALQAAVGAFLNRRMGGRTGAIILGIDNHPKTDDQMVLDALGIGRIDPNSADRPIFLQGDPTDFRCLSSDRLVIVYSAEDAERLLRYSPDFHAITLGKVVYDRARDRGFFTWSAGWTGGTVRLRIESGRWVAEEIDAWIS
jgi:hypothetical protein